MESMVFYTIHLSKTRHLLLTIESTMLHTSQCAKTLRHG